MRIPLSFLILLCIALLGTTFVAMAWRPGEDGPDTEAVRVTLDEGIAAYAGIGVPIDWEFATDRFEEAATTGDVVSRVWRARLAFEGHGRYRRDEAQAVETVRRLRAGLAHLAERGDREARFILGTLHQHGIGIPENQTTARAHFEIAAKADHLIAMTELGKALRDGIGGEQDRDAARRWFARAAKNGSSEGMVRLAEALEVSNMVESVRLYRKADALNHAEAAWRLSRLLDAGHGVPEDDAESRRLAARAAELDTTGEYALAYGPRVANWARECLAANDMSGALTVLHEARRARPRDPHVRTFHAAVLIEAGHPELAHDIIMNVLDDFPRWSEAYRILGEVEYVSERLEAAVGAWEKALELGDLDSDKSFMTRLQRVRREARIESPMAERNSEFFTLKFHESDRGRAAIVEKWLIEARTKVGDALEAWPTSRLTVILYRSGEIQKIRRLHVWVGAFFDGKIRVPIRDFDGNRAAIQSTILHEYTHFAVRTIHRHAPRWIHEGLAQWMEGVTKDELGNAERKLLVERNAGRLRPMTTLTHFGEFDAREADTAYAQSLSFTAYLLKTFTTRELSQALGQMTHPESFPEILDRVYQRQPIAAIEAEWRRVLSLTR